MKNRLLALALLLSFGLSAQTVLHSFAFPLKKPADRQQLLVATNDPKGLYVLASDKERATVFSYNSAIFQRDSLSAERPDKEYTGLGGYSADGTALTVYWISDDFEKVLGCRYDFDSRTVNRSLHTFDFREETLMTSFTENGSFYVVTASDKTPGVKFYRFHTGAPEVHNVDFSGFSITDTRNKTVRWNELFQTSGIQKMESELPNPAASSTAPVKLYKTADGFVMTVDVHRNQTALYTIGPDFSVTEKIVAMPELKGAERQNSFYHESRLYQLIVAEEAMLLSCTDLETMAVLGSYSADAGHNISFRNSPLLAQTNDGDANQIKDSKRFLRRLSGSRVGLSVYRTPEDILITIGGMRDMATAGDVLLGIAAGTSIVLGGGDFDGFDAGSSQFVFFDAVFDDAFRHKDMPPQLLAMDKVGQTMDGKKQVLSAIAVYQDDVVQAVYDAAKKEIILRRFRDGAGE